MAKQKEQKAPGRLKQVVAVFRQTMKLDKSAIWITLLGFLAPTALAVGFAAITQPGVLGWILYVLLGATIGMMLALIIMSRKAERAAYTSNAGKPGAVTLALQGAFRKGWRGVLEPVAVNPRSLAAVYRIVGRPGIVFIAEGNRGDAAHLLEAERKRVVRAAQGVPVHAVWVTTDEKATPLHELPKTLNKMKPTLNRKQVSTVYARMIALHNALPIPKGIDPRKRPTRR
jgi:hypothetical protein